MESNESNKKENEAGSGKRSARMYNSMEDCCRGMYANTSCCNMMSNMQNFMWCSDARQPRTQNNKPEGSTNE